MKPKGEHMDADEILVCQRAKLAYEQSKLPIDMLAELVGVKAPMLRKHFRCENRIPSGRLKKFSVYCNKPVDWFFQTSEGDEYGKDS